MSNIKDVAKLAKVSPATVSNVINKTANVRPKTMNRVLAAIETLKFSPNHYAKNLRIDKSNLFAIIVCELDKTTQRIIEGITDTCEKKGYSCNLYITHHNRSKEIKYLQDIQSTGVAGIFLQTCDNTINENISAIINKDIPIIFIDNYIKNMLNLSIIFSNTSLIEDALLNYIEENPNILSNSDSTLFISANDRYSNDTDAKIGVERVLKNNYTHYVVPATEEESFYMLVKYFAGKETFPKLIISPRESITSAIIRLIEFYNIDVDLIYLTSENEIPSPHRIALSRRSYNLGVMAVETIFKYIKSSLQFDKTLTIIGNKKKYNEILPKYPTNQTKLHLILYDGPTASAIIPATKAFTKIYNVDIQYDLLHYDELYNKINEIKRNQDNSIDILMIDLPWFKIFNNNDFLFPLNEFINNDYDDWLTNYSEEIKKVYFYTGSTIYSVPILANMQFLFYRKDLFESDEIKRDFFNIYGIELNVPQSWREFALVAKFFTKKYNPNSPVIYGTDIQGMDPISIADEFFPRQWAYEGKMISSRKIPILNSLANQRALQNLKEIYEYTNKNKTDHSWKVNFTRMINNEIAMSFNFSTHIGFESTFKYMTDFSNIAVTQAPGKCSMLGGYNLGINAFSQNKELAYLFIKWLTSGERALNNTIMGCCIPHNIVFEDDKCLRMYPWLQEMKKYIISAKAPEVFYDYQNNLIPPNQINNLVYSIVMDVFDNKDIQKTLEKSEEILKNIINNSPKNAEL